ncbi:hypothetical protein HPB47_013624 [Ixodes persulcatus]|uniref:Uncharacterized protein n=1 Tax=Ixodes persulcatus TaxID=34615 RepID=A0AC60R0S6_IXOPE|nr:hypothetical protein HPB47_013624 [Ixodes persulcatus]
MIRFKCPVSVPLAHITSPSPETTSETWHPPANHTTTSVDSRVNIIPSLNGGMGTPISTTWFADTSNKSAHDPTAASPTGRSTSSSHDTHGTHSGDQNPYHELYK